MTEPRDQWQTIEKILRQAIDELVTKLEWQTYVKLVARLPTRLWLKQSLHRLETFATAANIFVSL